MRLITKNRKKNVKLVKGTALLVFVGRRSARVETHSIFVGVYTYIFNVESLILIIMYVVLMCVF